MCNNCYCENQEKCSIVGHQPYGFCCNQCVYYDETTPGKCLRMENKEKLVTFLDIFDS